MKSQMITSVGKDHPPGTTHICTEVTRSISDSCFELTALTEVSAWPSFPQIYSKSNSDG